ncbi:MAG: hypothetical protein NT038_02425 [Euryarchaeota archaeon]|nr:hypothetical protein [Euryarchaeota archaeon]
MDAHYTPKGPKGTTCTTCVHFKAHKENCNKGLCFGHEVISAGCCYFFKKK